MEDSFENIPITLKRKPNPIETDEGKIFTDLLNKSNYKRYSRYTSLGVVFAERLNRTIRDFCKRPVLEKGDANWIDVLPKITKHLNY